MEAPTQQRYSFGPFVLDPVEKVLLRDGHPVYGCAIADKFTDIGTPDNYRRLAARARDSRTD